ncbi:hypothetical protein AGMMS49921_04690 [Endomicrobiia bacterium]|nr:hypothetical protein AGMMS49921_04690 [Endomicrobiia bacterium]
MRKLDYIKREEGEEIDVNDDVYKDKRRVIQVLFRQFTRQLKK